MFTSVPCTPIPLARAPCSHPRPLTLHLLLAPPARTQPTPPSPAPLRRLWERARLHAPAPSAGSCGGPEGALKGKPGGGHAQNRLGAATPQKHPPSMALPPPGAPRSPAAGGPGGPQHLAAVAALRRGDADISSKRDASGALSRSSRLIKSQTSCSSNCFNLFAYGWGRGERHVALAAFMGTIWKPFITICCSGAGGGSGSR